LLICTNLIHNDTITDQILKSLTVLQVPTNSSVLFLTALYSFFKDTDEGQPRKNERKSCPQEAPSRFCSWNPSRARGTNSFWYKQAFGSQCKIYQVGRCQLHPTHLVCVFSFLGAELVGNAYLPCSSIRTNGRSLPCDCEQLLGWFLPTFARRYLLHLPATCPL